MKIAEVKSTTRFNKPLNFKGNENTEWLAEFSDRLDTALREEQRTKKSTKRFVQEMLKILSQKSKPKFIKAFSDFASSLPYDANKPVKEGLQEVQEQNVQIVEDLLAFVDSQTRRVKKSKIRVK